MHRDTAGEPLPWWAYCVACGNPHSAPEWRVTTLSPSPLQGPGLLWWHVGTDLQTYTSVCKECCLSFAVADVVAELQDGLARAVSEYNERGGNLQVVPGEFAPPFRAERPQLFWPPYPHRGVAPPEWWLRDPSVGPHGWWAFEEHSDSSASAEVPTEPARPAGSCWLEPVADAGPSGLLPG